MPGNHWFLLPFIEKSCFFWVFLSSIIDVYWFSTERQLLLSFIHGKLWYVIDFPLKIIKSYRFSIDLIDFNDLSLKIMGFLIFLNEIQWFMSDLPLQSIVFYGFFIEQHCMYRYFIENQWLLSVSHWKSVWFLHRQLFFIDFPSTITDPYWLPLKIKVFLVSSLKSIAFRFLCHWKKSLIFVKLHIENYCSLLIVQCRLHFYFCWKSLNLIDCSVKVIDC